MALTEQQKSAYKAYKKTLKPKQRKRLKEVVSYLKQSKAADVLADYLAPHVGLDEADMIRNSAHRLNSSSLMSDPALASQEMGFLEDRLRKSLTMMPADAKTKLYSAFGGGNPSGYDPSGSILRKIYSAPYAVYAFVGDTYWAAWKSRRVVRVEVQRDGILFKSADGVSKRKIRLVLDIIKELDLLRIREELIDHLNLFGNAWLRPTYNVLGGFIGLEVLQPERVIPKWDNYFEKVVGWYYEEKGKRNEYKLDDFIHLKTYSSRDQSLGTPSLASVIVDIEASIFASLFNQTVFQKGGMIGSIVSMKHPDPSSLLNDRNFSLLADTVQARFEKQRGGIKGAGQILISPFVDKVFKLMNLGEMDGSFKTMTEATDRKIAQLLCCAPEKIGIPISSQYQDRGQVSDRISEAFDNEVAYLCEIVDRWINSLITKLTGIEDVKIVSGGAYKSQAVAAAEYILTVSKAGGLLTRDEGREILKREPFGGEMGRELLDNSDSRIKNVITTSSSPTGGTTSTGGIPPAEIGPPLPNYTMAKKSWVVHTWDEVSQFSKYNLRAA